MKRVTAQLSARVAMQKKRPKQTGIRFFCDQLRRQMHSRRSSTREVIRPKDKYAELGAYLFLIGPRTVALCLMLQKSPIPNVWCFLKKGHGWIDAATLHTMMPNKKIEFFLACEARDIHLRNAIHIAHTQGCLTTLFLIEVAEYELSTSEQHLLTELAHYYDTIHHFPSEVSNESLLKAIQRERRHG